MIIFINEFIMFAKITLKYILSFKYNSVEDFFSAIILSKIGHKNHLCITYSWQGTLSSTNSKQLSQDYLSH